MVFFVSDVNNIQYKVSKSPHSQKHGPNKDVFLIRDAFLEKDPMQLHLSPVMI